MLKHDLSKVTVASTLNTVYDFADHDKDFDDSTLKLWSISQTTKKMSFFQSSYAASEPAAALDRPWTLLVTSLQASKGQAKYIKSEFKRSRMTLVKIQMKVHCQSFVTVFGKDPDETSTFTVRNQP